MLARTTPRPGGPAETEIDGSLTWLAPAACAATLEGRLGRERRRRAYDVRHGTSAPATTRRNDMATKGTDSGVYRVTEIIGTSNVSWEDAAKTAVETAAKSLRDLRVAEVTKLDMKIEAGKVVAFRAK